MLALPKIVAAVRGRVPVLVDGGIRRGTDVIKALALGASAVLIGRPVIHALAVDGRSGVHRALDLLHVEIDNCLAQVGANCVADVNVSMIVAAQVAARL